MTQVFDMDSNITGLRFAEETSIGTLPGSPVWYGAEPNAYTNFGGKLTLKARNPINDTRQRKKGVITDLDASGAFTQDITQLNMQRLLQGFMYASFREKFDTQSFGSTAIPITDIDNGTSKYEAASGLGGVKTGALLVATGNNDSGNDGLRHVTGQAATYVTVAETLITDAAPAAASRLVEVGFEFGSAEVNIDVSHSLPRLVRTGAVAASKAFTFSDVGIDGETVTIGGQVYTFKTALTPAANEVLVAGTATAQATYLFEAINKGANGGTHYAAATVANAFVSATNGSPGIVTVTALTAGRNGNTIAIAETCTNGSWAGGATFLSGGLGKDILDFNLIPGEWIFIGGDASNTSFVNAVNNGRKRVNVVTNDYIEFDKSFTTMLAETGTGLTVDIYFGRVLKNEARTLIKRRSYQWERTLGAPDDAQPTQIQAEYLPGSCGNQLDLKFTSANILEATMAFLSTDNEQRLSTDGLKGGSRPAIPESDAFNATSDVKCIKLAQYIPGSPNPAPLFAFALDVSLTLKNNLTANKAIGTLGAIDVTAGEFDVSGKITAYFADIAAVQAVRNNVDITLDTHLWKANAGVTIDLPLISLGGGDVTVAQNKAIELPLDMDAATAKKLDVNKDYTLLWVFYDYLPNLADLANT